MKSPYLRSYVVARINPVRFHKMKAGDKKPVMPIAQALLRMVAVGEEVRPRQGEHERPRVRRRRRRIGRIADASFDSDLCPQSVRSGHVADTLPIRAAARLFTVRRNSANSHCNRFARSRVYISVPIDTFRTRLSRRQAMSRHASSACFPLI